MKTEEISFIDEVRIDRRSLLASRDDKTLSIEPKVMDFIWVLGLQPQITWTRDELIDKIWGAEGGSDESLTRLASQARKCFRSLGIKRPLIKTVYRIGYRLDARIAEELSDERNASLKSGTARELYRPNWKIAVLNFESDLDAPAERYLVEGWSRDLTRLLSCVPQFFVAPYSSSSLFNLAVNTAAEISDGLDVEFIIAGTIRRFGQNVRLRVDLIDGKHGMLVWSERYDADIDDFFEVQAECAIAVATAISTGLKWEAPPFKISSRPFNDEVYQLLQQAEKLRMRYSRTAAVKITRLLRDAVNIEPENAIALGQLAVQLSQNLVSQWSADRDDTAQEASRLIQTAMRLDPQNPDVLSSAGIVSAMLHRPADAIKFLSMACSINPNDPHASAVLGWQICLLHNEPEGLELIEKAERMAPHHPRFGLWATYRGTACLFMLDYAQAVPICREAMLRTPNYYQPLLTSAWAELGAGNRDAALELIQEVARSDSPGVVSNFVSEMKKWSANSPNRRHCHDVLNGLLELSA